MALPAPGRDAIAALVDKYRLLEALRLGEAGRTVARRDAMRAIADRFPGALREWDELPGDELQRRHRDVTAALASIDGGGSPVAELAASSRHWMRAGLALHDRLRLALAVKRWLAGRPLTAALVDDARARFGIDAAALTAVATPPDGRLTAAVYAGAAADLGISVAALKAALFTCDGVVGEGAVDEASGGEDIVDDDLDRAGR